MLAVFHVRRSDVRRLVSRLTRRAICCFVGLFDGERIAWRPVNFGEDRNTTNPNKNFGTLLVLAAALGWAIACPPFFKWGL